MHLLLKILVIWALVGGMRPAIIVAGAAFVGGRWKTNRMVAYTIVAGPQTWIFLLVCWMISALMALRHRMQRGKPLVPPGTVAPADGPKT